jgi:hypothetical protein
VQFMSACVLCSLCKQGAAMAAAASFHTGTKKFAVSGSGDCVLEQIFLPRVFTRLQATDLGCCAACLLSKEWVGCMHEEEDSLDICCSSKWCKPSDPKPEFRILCTLWYSVKWNNCKCRWESPLDGHRIISRSASTTTYE